MSPKQQRFIQEYIIDLNGAAAARRAGYSARTANRRAEQLLRDPAVSAAVAKEQKRIANKLEITAERVLKELARVGMSEGPTACMTQTRRGIRIDLKKLSDDERRAVSEISDGANGIRIKFHDKVRALITLGQYLGIVVERHEHSGSIDAGDMSDEQLDRIIAAGEARKGAAPGTEAHASVPAGGLVGP